MKVGLEREIKEVDRRIREARRATTAALTLEEKLSGQKQIRTLDALRNQMRRSLFEAQDKIDRDREELIVRIEEKLKQKVRLERLIDQEVGWPKNGKSGDYWATGGETRRLHPYRRPT